MHNGYYIIDEEDEGGRAFRELMEGVDARDKLAFDHVDVLDPHREVHILLLVQEVHDEAALLVVELQGEVIFRIVDAERFRYVVDAWLGAVDVLDFGRVIVYVQARRRKTAVRNARLHEIDVVDVNRVSAFECH